MPNWSTCTHSFIHTTSNKSMHMLPSVIPNFSPLMCSWYQNLKSFCLPQFTLTIFSKLQSVFFSLSARPFSKTTQERHQFSVSLFLNLKACASQYLLFFFYNHNINNVIKILSLLLRNSLTRASPLWTHPIQAPRGRNCSCS